MNKDFDININKIFTSKDLKTDFKELYEAKENINNNFERRSGADLANAVFEYGKLSGVIETIERVNEFYQEGLKKKENKENKNESKNAN